MRVSSSNVSVLAAYATEFQSSKVKAKVAEKVLDQVQDQTQYQADALCDMIEQSSQLLEECGQLFDIHI